MGNERKTVYIPIEIKFREYPGALILAASLCDKGARVYVGSKSAIYDIIFSKKDKAGVFLYKGTKHREFFLQLKKKVQVIAILDQELGVAHDLTDKDYSEAVLDRFIFGTEDLIDFYFVIGSRYRAAVAATVPLLKSKIINTGWPKFDLLTKYRKETYSRAANQIRSKYGEFLLFSSDFGSNTPQKLMGAHLQDAKSGVEFRVKNINKRHKKRKRAFEEFESMVSFLRTCDAIDGILPIIVRPHPGDDKDIWQQKLAGLRKTKVIYEQSSAPWIMASCGVLHRGCSSAVEAYVMGIKAGYIVLDTFAPRNNLPFLLSEKLSSGSCVEKFGSKREVLSCNGVASEAYSKDVFREVLYTPDSSASDLISGILLSSKVSEEEPWTRSFFYSWKKQARRVFDAFKKRVSGTQNTNKVKDYGLARPSEKLPKGINQEEAEEFFGQLGFNRFRVSLTSKNAICIEKK